MGSELSQPSAPLNIHKSWSTLPHKTTGGPVRWGGGQTIAILFCPATGPRSSVVANRSKSKGVVTAAVWIAAGVIKLPIWRRSGSPCMSASQSLLRRPHPALIGMRITGIRVPQDACLRPTGLVACIGDLRRPQFFDPPDAAVFQPDFDAMGVGF